ncbi:hypothetical protein JCM11491_006968 [Sporobolomyces phaffii]
MAIFKRNSTTKGLVDDESHATPPSKLKKSREGGSGWRTRLGARKGSVDSSDDTSRRRRGSTESDSSFVSSSSCSNPSTCPFFDSPRTSISSSAHSIRRLATSSSTPSLHLTPPTPQLAPADLDGGSETDDDGGGGWPFSSSSCASSDSSSLFSVSSSSSLSSTSSTDEPRSSPSLFLSFLLKASFPQVPPRPELAIEVLRPQDRGPSAGFVVQTGGTARRGSEPSEKRRTRLIDYHLDSSLRG